MDRPLPSVASGWSWITARRTKMKKKEIGIPKSAPKAVKKADEAMDKKKGIKEGSPADLKADKALTAKAKKGGKLKVY